MPILRSKMGNLYYEAAGDGQPLVFIHGWGSSTQDWDFQVAYFSKAFKVITFDLRGHGRSDKPPGPYKMTMFAADLAILVRALALEPLHLVGLSLGGAVAFQFAIDHPELVKSMTVINSGPTLRADPAEARRIIESRVALVQDKGIQALGQALSDTLFPKPQHESLRETLVDRWANNNPRAYIDAGRAWLDWSVVDKLDSIRCPTLVISSDHDMWPLAVKEAYVEQMPNAQLVVISDAHHFVTREKPERTNAVLMAFLEKHS